MKEPLMSSLGSGPKLVASAQMRGPFLIATMLGTLVLFGTAALASTDDPAASDPALQTERGHLGTVVVTGRMLGVRNAIDRKIYTVTDDVQTAFGSVADVLSAIPSVEIDANGALALRGDTNVLVLVDGQPLAQASSSLSSDALQQIPAEDIERIEVLTTPPPQFKANGSGGVINIITRKNRPSGVSGTARGSVGNRGRDVAGASGNYHLGNLNLSGSLNLRQDNKQRQVTSDTAVLDPATNSPVLGHTAAHEDIRRRLPLGKIAIAYDFTKAQSVDLSISQGARSGDRSSNEDHTRSLGVGGPITVSDRVGDGRDSSRNSDQRLVFTHKFLRPAETLSVLMHHSAVTEDQNNQYIKTLTEPPAAPTGTELDFTENRSIKDLGVDYVFPIARGRILKAGYLIEEDKTVFGFAGALFDPATRASLPNSSSSDAFRYSQRVNALYASLQASVGRWSWLVGARAEKTVTRATQSTGVAVVDRSDSRVYPSLHLERAISDEATLSVSASRRISWPSPSALDPYISPLESHDLHVGNPSLLPQDTRSFELGYSVDGTNGTYSVTAYLQRNRNALTDVTQFIGQDVALTTKENLPRSNSTGLEFSVNGRLTSTVSYGLSGNLFHSDIDATALGASVLQTTTGINGKLSLDYRLTTADTAQFKVSRSDKRLTPQGYVGAINQVNVAYKHKIDHNLTAIVTVADLFNGQVFRRSLSTPTFTSDYKRQVVGRRAYVGLVYNFGAGKKRKAEKTDDEDQ